MSLQNKLIAFIFIILLAANSVDGGSGTAALCNFGCNVAYAACVSGVTGYSGGTALMTALETCSKVQTACSLACQIVGFTPTP